MPPSELLDVPTAAATRRRAPPKFHARGRLSPDLPGSRTPAPAREMGGAPRVAQGKHRGDSGFFVGSTLSTPRFLSE
jgi:hypothetical protein